MGEIEGRRQEGRGGYRGVGRRQRGGKETGGEGRR